MGQIERLFLWIILAVVLVGWVVSTAVLSAEIGTLNQQLVALAGTVPAPDAPGGGADPSPTGGWPAPGGQGAGRTAQVAIAGVTVLSDSLSMTVTVRAYGVGDLLFEPPVLRAEDGSTYPVTGASLEAARLAFLDLVTRGEATAQLEFAGRPPAGEPLWLVFNPHQEPTNVTAPPLRFGVPLEAGDGTPEPGLGSTPEPPPALTPAPTDDGWGG